MSTLNTADMSVPEIQAAVSRGDLDAFDVHFTDEQAAEGERLATITIAELHNALDALFAGDEEFQSETGDAGAAVEVMLAAVLGVIAENRRMDALMTTIGSILSADTDDEFYAAIFG